jgi:hypothetical protein
MKHMICLKKRKCLGLGRDVLRMCTKTSYTAADSTYLYSIFTYFIQLQFGTQTKSKEQHYDSIILFHYLLENSTLHALVF